MFERSGLFEFKKRGSKLKSVKYPKLNITFMTVHMAKGLGYDNVIVVNGKNEAYGFPSKIEDDPVLSFVIKGDNSIDYAEERRLFYVAMTRTKNRVYFIAPEQNPSEFLLEIKRDFKNVVLKGSWNEELIKHNMAKKICPICGYPMQLRYKNAYGLRLYLCTNEPEICGFMTNEVKAGKLAIMKCDKCRDGYLIVKPTNGNGYFLGCTNYKANKTGCNNSISSADYYTMMNFTPEPAVSIDQRRESKIRTKNIVEKGELIVDEQKYSLPAVNPKTNFIGLKVVPLSNSEEDEDTKQQAQPSNQFFSRYPVKDKTSIKDEMNKVVYKGFNLYEVVIGVLKCLEHISINRYYSMTILIATVRGGNRKQMEKDNLKSVPEYGMFAEMKRDDMRAIVQWLMDNHYVLRTKEYYAKIHPTYEGIHFEETITLKKLKDLKRYLEDPDREVLEDENVEED